MIRLDETVGPRPGHAVAAGHLGRDSHVARYDAVRAGSLDLQALVLEAARAAEVPASVINLLKAATQRTLAAVGAELSVLPARDTLCAAVVDEGRTIHVRDVTEDDRWGRRHPFTDGRWGRVRFYGSHPLVSPDGAVVGTLCVLDHRPRVLSTGQVDALDALAARVVETLERERLVALHDAVERLDLALGDGGRG